jgi:hypothetical protein
MTDLAAAILAGIGAYIGSVYALSKRHSGLAAPDATAQAYRDAITALLNLQRAYLKMEGGMKRDEPVADDLRIGVDRAYEHVGYIKTSAGFLLSQADFEAMHEARRSTLMTRNIGLRRVTKRSTCCGGPLLDCFRLGSSPDPNRT